MARLACSKHDFHGPDSKGSRANLRLEFDALGPTPYDTAIVSTSPKRTR